MSGKFELYQSEKNDRYYFRLKASNGENVLASQGYSNKSGAENGIQSVRTNCKDESSFEKSTTSSGQYRFALKANNGQIIGTSQNYKTEKGRDNGVQAVERAADGAEVADLTS